MNKTSRARQRRIPVHELQHSAITPYSLGYSYPGRPEVATSPDTVLCFGPFWTHATEFPRNTTPRVIGRPRVMDAELSRGGVRRPRHVLVISQSVLGQALLTLVARAAALAPDYRFVFRPHPSELESDLHGSLAAAGLALPANLSIVSGGEPLYRQLAEAALQVGVFSTGLFEGMTLGCRTIVADLPGAEAMGAVIERGDALLVETPEDLAAALPRAPIAKPNDYYAEPVASILQLLDS